jgi:hypothetical protein
MYILLTTDNAVEFCNTEAIAKSRTKALKSEKRFYSIKHINVKNMKCADKVKTVEYPTRIPAKHLQKPLLPRGDQMDKNVQRET